MAKVLFTAVVADMRGKLAGTVFTRNRGGAVARTKVSPVNRRTSTQQQARANFGSLSSGFRALSNLERETWIAGSENFKRTDQFKNAKQLSGQQLFVSLNSNLRKIGRPALTVCPIPGGTAIDIQGSNYYVQVDNANTIKIELVLEDLVTAPNIVPYVRATRPLSQGVSNPAGMFREVNGPIGTPLVFGAATVFDMAQGYVNIFGVVPAAGQKVFFEITAVNEDTGEAGAPIILSAIAL